MHLQKLIFQMKKQNDVAFFDFLFLMLCFVTFFSMLLFKKQIVFDNYYKLLIISITIQIALIIAIVKLLKDK
jgi:hypothetical protein